MCDSKPITLLRTSFLKPVVTDVAMIITASPSAIPITEIVTRGREILEEESFLKTKRLAMKSS